MDDIQRVYDMDSHKTESAYVPTRIGVQNMTMQQLMPGLCYRADLCGETCRKCVGCRFGMRLLELLDRDAQELGAHAAAEDAGKPEAAESTPIKRRLTTAQAEKAEKSRQERRERVWEARRLIAEGHSIGMAAILAGYGSAQAYKKAERKCKEEEKREREEKTQ